MKKKLKKLKIKIKKVKRLKIDKILKNLSTKKIVNSNFKNINKPKI